ncbi:hypothetical protein [Reyranella sp.]|uniref:hypothetical protein n=1 Tax=Reyranella sp. TaxID=1929291 RepID=UPI00403744BF
MLRLATLAAAALVASAASPAFALDCPKPQPTAKPGILKETPAQMTAVGKQLASSDTFNAIASATADLRLRYPGVESAEVVNYLLTAYCPAVAADSKLSEAQKKAAVDGFAAKVMRQVY